MVHPSTVEPCPFDREEGANLTPESMRTITATITTAQGREERREFSDPRHLYKYLRENLKPIEPFKTLWAMSITRRVEPINPR